MPTELIRKGTFSFRNAAVQEDFYLLDVIGGTSTIVLHPHKPIIAYSTGNCFIHHFLGCMIIVYDILSDTKINLAHHHCEV